MSKGAGSRTGRRIPIRLGLCCTFVEEDIHFRRTTATALAKLKTSERAQRLRAIAANNARALRASIELCAREGIGDFRVNSQILPLRTHPELGYENDTLGEAVIEEFRRCGVLAREHDVRLSFHPDQFVVLSSPKSKVVESSLAEIEYQAEIAEWIGADVINVHGGGAYGDKHAALERFAAHFGALSPRAKRRLTLENDDRTYTPSDLLPLCARLGTPLVYDVHHHRCLPDGVDVERATALARATWGREPLFHISSPRGGWKSADPRMHSEMIDLRDFPRSWDTMAITVEVEAKAKELAVRKLKRALIRRSRRAAA